MSEAWEWVRTCQSCGAEDSYRSPKTYKDDKWRDVKCKHCKSIDLDYGHYRGPMQLPDGDWNE